MMTLDESIDYVASKFIYKNDPLILTDAWFVMRNKENGFYYGDCEDFSLTVFWCMCGGSIGMFIKNILNGTYKLHMVASNDNKNNHCIAEFKDLWFDNWTRKELSKDEFFKLTNHKYCYQINPFTIMCKLIIGLFYR